MSEKPIVISRNNIKFKTTNAKGSQSKVVTKLLINAKLSMNRRVEKVNINKNL